MRHCEQEPGKTWKVHEFWVENTSEKTPIKKCGNPGLQQLAIPFMRHSFLGDWSV